MASKAVARAGRGTSVQGSRASYYSSPGQGRTVVLAGGGQVRQQGRVYQVRTGGGSQLEGKLPNRTYHRIVLAEFIATIAIIGVSGVLVPARSDTGQDGSQEVSVSFAAPLVRLTAVCVVFFILALMATGPKAGKVAAAFGALVAAGAALNASEMWTALAKAIGGAVPGTGGGG